MLNLLPFGHLSRIAVAPGRDSVDLASVLAERYPSAEVIVWGSPPKNVCHSNLTVHKTEGVREMLETLMAGGKVQGIVDPSGDRTTFKNLFFTLTDGGAYVLPDVSMGGAAMYAASLLSAKLGGPVLDGDEKQLMPVISGIRFADEGCAIDKKGHHVYKIRDESANVILGGKAHLSRSSLLHTIPSGSFDNRSTVRTNSTSIESGRVPSSIEYPEMSLRAYEGVACYPGQVYVMGDVLLPDTFRHIRAHRLSNRSINDTAQWHVHAPARPQSSLAGTYYALDSELPGHFGHFTSEVLARMWGWERAKAAFPGIRALISLEPGHSQLAQWQSDLLSAAGIDAREIYTFSSPVFVERLIGATPMFSNPKYIQPDAINFWRATGKALTKSEVGHAKIFVSRKPLAGRGCTNALDVETYFQQKGFNIIFPEDYSISEQVSLFDNAEIIAGFAGSGMFSLMFTQLPKKVIIIGSESYDAVNEVLFMAAAGGDLTYFWCTPRIPMGEKWSMASFLSDYTFDFTRDGDKLEKSLT